MFSALKQIGQYDRTLVIFLSDHGESLGEHGEDEHRLFLYSATSASSFDRQGSARNRADRPPLRALIGARRLYIDDGFVDAFFLGLDLRVEILQALIGPGHVGDQLGHAVRVGPGLDGTGRRALSGAPGAIFEKQRRARVLREEKQRAGNVDRR